MRTVQFGEITTSVLGFGCGSVMGRVGRRDSLRAMHAAWEADVTLFDTARSYGYGEAEGVLGEFLAGRRAHATIVTKFGILPAPPSRWKRLAKPLVRGALTLAPRARAMVRRGIAGEMSAGHFDVATLRRSLDESLRHLRTDYVDVLLAHEAPASVMAQDDLLAELEEVIQVGKARRIGLACNFNAARQSMQNPPRHLGALQYPASMLEEDNSLAIDASAQVFAMANHPFGGGQRAAQLASAMHRLANDSAVSVSLREKLRGNAKTAAARFVFSNLLRTGIHVVVPSMLHLDNLRANIAAIEAGSLSTEECKTIEQWIAAAR